MSKRKSLGQDSTASGIGTIAKNDGSSALGTYNIGTSTDTILEIGNGTDNSSRSNALEVYTDGTVTAPEATTALIDSRGAKSLVTKEWAEANSSSATGLQALNEGNGIGWRLIGRDPANYGNIGLDATDLSYNGSTSTTRGATGDSSFAANYATQANGSFSVALGYRADAISHYSVAIGTDSTASGTRAISLRGTASGTSSISAGDAAAASNSHSIAIGYNTKATQVFQTALGTYNIGTSEDTLVEIGIGTSSTRKNGFEVYKDGTLTAPEATTTEINSRGAKALVTKEYLDNKVPDKTIIAEDNSIDFSTGINFEITATATTITATNIIPLNEGNIIIHSAENITGWGAEFKFKTVPTDLTGDEIFAYFIEDATTIWIGRIE